MQRGCESNVSAVKSPRPNHQSCCETTISTTCQVYFDVMRHPRSRTCQVCGNNDNPATSTTMRHQQQHSGSELKTPLVGHLRLDFTTTTHRQYNNNATTTHKQYNNNNCSGLLVILGGEGEVGVFIYSVTDAKCLLMLLVMFK